MNKAMITRVREALDILDNVCSACVVEKDKVTMSLRARKKLGKARLNLSAFAVDASREAMK